MSRKPKSRASSEPLLREETLQGVLAVLFFVVALVLVFAAFDNAGPAGRNVFRVLTSFVGIGFYILPVLSMFLSIGFLKALRGLFPVKKTVGAFILFLSGLATTNLLFPTDGGYLGNLLSAPMMRLFDIYTSLIIFIAIFIISVLVMFEASIPVDAFMSLWRGSEKKKSEPRITGLTGEGGPERSEKDEGTGEENEGVKPIEKKEDKAKIRKEEVPDALPIRPTRPVWSPYAPPSLSLLEFDKGKPGVGDIKANANIIKRTLQNFGIEVEMDEISIGPAVTRYALKPAESVRLSKIVALQRELELALAAHPIRIEAPIPGKSLVGIEIPNTVKATVGLATMLSSAEFTSSDKPLLMSLGKDLNGKAHFANLSKMPHTLIAGTTGSGKSVAIHTILTSLLYRNSPDDLKLILIDPKRVELTLYNKIPHLLTPVITDAKKAILALKWAAKEMDRRYDILESETVRDIQSYHKNIVEPEYKKFDVPVPKLTGASRPKRSPETEDEEQNRHGTPSTTSQSRHGEQSTLPERMPYIVIIIDELADIMATYPRELEAAIVRLAQMSRAVGIHLILSTQRPSVNVITGLIKANVPARIALQVSSQIDSRTILDTGGAEKLLGAGDMLFLSGEMSKPTRLQSPYISESEVKKVTSYLSNAYKDEVPNELNLGGDEGGTSIFENGVGDNEEIDDDLYEEAREEVIKAGKASTSYLQRKLRIGYSRAARLVDILEERGVIGSADGSKPRKVLGAAGHDAPSENAVDEDAPGPGTL
ncbi:MAG: hypothetical protein COV91_04755 [Candidatus Taylorbacteria bacterium CG11_big_fil_rev_8_21_14_0_20_46_11]|uniref:FtsK domain-containing protein n=1 Tax=Candidatus Taylorbacteria bacterium CG11_big_fil_rev_8_21_14_0_20_46_11 TaxID=1975025 RepID=A0A2H0KAP2_9BACT|nr:MAG: hypothetical protein COV91_04755 [Candidatus Taylorbacteria bacterium CG11_big_fil_rev_8_21_14_0_20_46_11]